MLTGVAIVRKAFYEENTEAVQAFLTEYAASTEYVNENPAEAAEWIAELGIVAKAPLAQKAIPACNLVCITGKDMQPVIGGYLEALHAQNPAAVQRMRADWQQLRSRSRIQQGLPEKQIPVIPAIQYRMEKAASPGVWKLNAPYTK